jgi:hypothetical protein
MLVGEADNVERVEGIGEQSQVAEHDRVGVVGLSLRVIDQRLAKLKRKSANQLQFISRLAFAHTSPETKTCERTTTPSESQNRSDFLSNIMSDR